MILKIAINLSNDINGKFLFFLRIFDKKWEYFFTINVDRKWINKRASNN